MKQQKIIQLAPDQFALPVQQVVLGLKHGKKQDIQDRQDEGSISMESVVPCAEIEFHLTTGALYKTENRIERRVYLDWHEYDALRDSSDWGKMLPNPRERFITDLIYYIAHDHGLNPQKIRTIYHVFTFLDRKGGEIMVRHPVDECVFNLGEIKQVIDSKLLEIQQCLQLPDTDLLLCSNQEQGRQHVHCYKQCLVREHCQQLVRDIQEEKRRLAAWNQKVGLPPISA